MNKRLFIILTAGILFFLAGSGLALAESQDPVKTKNGDYPLPKKISLVGERMPLEIHHVYERMDREFTIAVWDRPQVFMWLKRAGRFLPYIEKSLAAAGLPDDIKYLAIAESSFITDIRSRKAALGTWQFLAGTGRQEGLRKNRNIDERLNFEKSTKAAIRYLKKLRGKFGSWTNAMAAYNCGFARLEQEIQDQKVNDYYRLSLPTETERYIFRIAAIKIIMENPEAYGFKLDPEREYKPLAVEAVKVRLHAPVSITSAAKALGTDYRILKELNPQYLNRRFPAGKYEIIVPRGTAGRLKRFLKKAAKTGTKTSTARINISNKKYYRVRNGDSLSVISNRTGIPVLMLIKINNLKTTKIYPGQKLRLSKD